MLVDALGAVGQGDADLVRAALNAFDRAKRS